MLTTGMCPHCGSQVLPSTLAGLCPGCLLKKGLLADQRSDMRDLESSILAAMPSQDEPVGILKSIDETIGFVPHVLLRDGSPIDSKPAVKSSEIVPEQVGDGGRYQLFGEIARGGMGVILKGRDVDVGRDVAIKVLLERHLDNPEMVCRFVEEAQIAGQLQHPGIVPIYELGRLPDGRLYIAMKLVRGSTLAAMLEGRSKASADLPRYLPIFEQICQTMAYAHACGVVHRDLKPTNVMVGSFGEIQIMDWGLAKVLDVVSLADEKRNRKSRLDSDTVYTLRTGSTTQDSQFGSVLGTPSYMAPEQAQGLLETLDERADVFGLGAILCEILTGAPPYSGASSDETYRKAAKADLSEAFARLDQCGADSELIAIAKSCLATTPKERPRDARVVSASVTTYLESVQERLRTSQLARAQAESKAIEERKRRFLVLGLAISLFMLLFIVGGGAMWVSQMRAAGARAINRDAQNYLHETSMLLSRARSARDIDLEAWSEVIQAANRTERLLAFSEVTTEIRQEIQQLVPMVQQEYREAKNQSKDNRMRKKLSTIKDEIDRHRDFSRANRENAEAFRDYGLDLEHLQRADAVRLIKVSPLLVDLVNGLDQWTFVRRVIGSESANELSEIAKFVDPDPWRCKLRDALELEARDPKAAYPVLVELAESAPNETIYRESISRLAHSLTNHDEEDKSVVLLRRIQRAYPNDFWINCQLAGSLLKAEQPEEAVRFYSVAVSIRPDSERALISLQSALKSAGLSE